MKLLRSIPVLLLATLAVAAPAQIRWDALPYDEKAAMAGGPPEKVISLVVYGADNCPKGEGDEIVVCARRPEGERYRVPPRLRKKKEMLASEGSWSNSVQQLEWVSRTAGGLPNTCSPIGSGGATGCYRQFIQRARAERDYDRAQAGQTP